MFDASLIRRSWSVHKPKRHLSNSGLLVSFGDELLMFVALTGFILVFAVSALAQKQKLDLKVVDRRDNETDYTYVVPAHFNSYSNSSVNCSSGLGTVNCSGSTTTTGSASPARQVSYQVRGATFSLLLPDDRLVIVNCESKFVERFAGPAGNHRSCRVPLVDHFQAEFNGDKAKLIWVVSIDGKKTQSETYKVLAIFDRK
jgi:hypothetical protein